MNNVLLFVDNNPPAPVVNDLFPLNENIEISANLVTDKFLYFAPKEHAASKITFKLNFLRSYLFLLDLELLKKKKGQIAKILF